MAKISPIPQATAKFAQSFQTTEFAKLNAQFQALLSDVNREIVETGKTRGQVQLLGSGFTMRPQTGSRDAARSIAKPIVADSALGNVEGPTQLVLRNLKRTPDLQEIKITIPTTGDSKGKVSLITVTNKDAQTVSFTPSSKVFIKKDPAQSGRTRITEHAVKNE